MPVGESLNIFHVTAGKDRGSPGDRQFALFRNWNSQKLSIHINYPKVGVYPHKVFHLDCEDGSWNTYSVEVRQVEGSQALIYIVSMDGNIIESGSFDQSAAVSSGDLKVFVSDDWYPAATDFLVKNFFYQTFKYCSSTDPCSCLGIRQLNTGLDYLTGRRFYLLDTINQYRRFKI